MKRVREFLKNGGSLCRPFIFLLAFSLLTGLSFSGELPGQKKESMTQTHKQLFAKIKHLFPGDIKGFEDLKTAKCAPALKKLLKVKSKKKFFAGAVAMLFYEYGFGQKRADIIECLLDEKIIAKGHPHYQKISKGEYLEKLKKQLSQLNDTSPLISIENIEVFELEEAAKDTPNFKGIKLGHAFLTKDMLWVKITMTVIEQKEPEIKYLLIRKTGDGWKIAG